jgi:biotin synthase
MDKLVFDLARRVLDGAALTRDEALSLTRDSAPLEDVLHGANRIRAAFRGDEISFCSIVNVKASACGEDCAFCAQSARHQTGAPVYPLMDETAVSDAARQARDSGSSELGLVAAWRGLKAGTKALDQVCRGLATVREAGVEPHGSLGFLDDDSARTLAAAGCVEYNHNLETSERFFPKICTTHQWRDRLATVLRARAAGMKVCSGGIFGLGEAWEDRVDLALALCDVAPDTVPINFLHPVDGTPLAGRPLMAPREALRIIALFRYMLPRADIKTCGGRELVLRDLQSWMFHAGASSTMLGNYLTTTGRKPADDLRMIEDLGFKVRQTPVVSE